MRWLYHVRFAGREIGLGTEGFIHASFQPAVSESARLYFPAGARLEVLQIDPRRVRFEVVATPRGPMPHILEAIPEAAIAAVLALDALSAAPDHLE